jgi:hypothetical protein
MFLPVVREYLPGPAAVSICGHLTSTRECGIGIEVTGGQGKGDREEVMPANAWKKKCEEHLADGLVILPHRTLSNLHGKSDMQRMKDTGGRPAPHPASHWLAGMLIGTAIMTMATQAMLLGAGAAIKDATLKGR